VDWTLHLSKFANMKTQLPHFRKGFGITPNEGSTISAFYSATCALIVWLGSHGGALAAQQFADTWALGHDLTSPETWQAPLLEALSKLHALLLQDYGCVEQTAGSHRASVLLAVSGPLPSSSQPSVGSRNPRPLPSPLTLPQPWLRMLFQSAHDERQGADASAEPGERTTKSPLQRTLTAQIMGLWAKHNGAVEHIGVKLSLEMLEMQVLLCTFGRTTGRATLPDWIYSQRVYFEPKTGDEVEIFGFSFFK